MPKKYLGLTGNNLNWAISTVAGCDFLLFGYDQGVMGGILTLDTFRSTFPTIDDSANGDFTGLSQSTRSVYQGISVGSYNLGCFLGAVITIFIGNTLGRRRMIFLGTSIMVVGALLQATAMSLPHFIIGRIITGLGNGGNTSTVPMWQSETCSSHKRGKLVMIEGALITAGVMMSYWIDFGLSFAEHTSMPSVTWRFPLAFQIVFCIFILAFVLGLPESPRWLVYKGRSDEARDVIASISNSEPTDSWVENEVHAIEETNKAMGGSYSEIFTNGENRNLHRTILGFVNQMFQQISGINLITYYAAVIYSNLGMSQTLARLLAALNGTEYFIASWPAVFLVERVGRRKLMLFGAVGQAVTMALLAGINSRKESGFQITGIVFLFVFNTFFAVGWLGMTWLYPAEITPLRIRAPANAISTAANWIFNFMVVMVTPVAFKNIEYHTYTIFAVINAIMVPSVYFFFPETAYRSLEEMDTIFSKVSGPSAAWEVVKIAETEPRQYGKNGERLTAYDDTEKATVEHGNDTTSDTSRSVAENPMFSKHNEGAPDPKDD